MKRIHRLNTSLLPALGLSIATALPGAVQAQNFPARPLHMLVPFSAGGPADLYARELSQGMSTRLGQPVVVENKGGAGGIPAIDQVAKATPDGYTLGLTAASALVMAPYARAKLPYDPNRDFALLTTVASNPEVLVVNNNVPARNLRELVSWLKANPGKVNYGSTGSGTVTHLAVEMLKVQAGVDILHVPYKGAAPVATDLMGGQVQLAILGVPAVLSQSRAGKIRALAVTTEQRIAAMPDVPTSVESGYPKLLTDYWYGLIVATATAEAVQARLRTAAVATLQSASVQEQFGKASAKAFASTPEQFRTFMLAEQDKWGSIIKAIGFKED